MSLAAATDAPSQLHPDGVEMTTFTMDGVMPDVKEKELKDALARDVFPKGAPFYVAMSTVGSEFNTGTCRITVTKSADAAAIQELHGKWAPRASDPPVRVAKANTTRNVAVVEPGMWRRDPYGLCVLAPPVRLVFGHLPYDLTMGEFLQLLSEKLPYTRFYNEAMPLFCNKKTRQLNKGLCFVEVAGSTANVQRVLALHGTWAPRDGGDAVNVEFARSH
eukprot:CAMPEP_0176432870 /NCGR_PEP_ID=MMETSP0127-20121128/15652_1 /TAXON_ID=938130 /ORGANISM="Platyophrya macrostoma, Strain WH" /LENGTH=218 /DNA_ID=CAMNT_0017815125 /DNA_START=42 /DNA_END=698 /DNA_ORIENTATION=+